MCSTFDFVRATRTLQKQSLTWAVGESAYNHATFKISRYTPYKKYLMRFKCQIDSALALLKVFLWLCVSVQQEMCCCMWIHTDTKPLCLFAVDSPPPPHPFWLGRSWGLTFHFSDPLFLRANSYAGLEMCYVAGWDKNQGQCQNNSWLPVLGYLCSSPLLHVYFDDITSIMSLTVNKDHCATFPSHLIVHYISTFSLLASVKMSFPIYYISLFCIFPLCSI